MSLFNTVVALVLVQIAIVALFSSSVIRFNNKTINTVLDFVRTTLVIFDFVLIVGIIENIAF